MKKVKNLFGHEVTIVKTMRDYSKDPYFVKKFEEAKRFLEKHPIPERFKSKQFK